MAIKTQVQYEIITKTPFSINEKIKHLKNLSALDNSVLEKLVKLANNPKAVNQIQNNFEMIKSFLG